MRHIDRARAEHDARNSDTPEYARVGAERNMSAVWREPNGLERVGGGEGRIGIRRRLERWLFFAARFHDDVSGNTRPGETRFDLRTDIFGTLAGKRSAMARK